MSNNSVTENNKIKQTKIRFIAKSHRPNGVGFGSTSPRRFFENEELAKNIPGPGNYKILDKKIKIQPPKKLPPLKKKILFRKFDPKEILGPGLYDPDILKKTSLVNKNPNKKIPFTSSEPRFQHNSFNLSRKLSAQKNTVQFRAEFEKVKIKDEAAELIKDNEIQKIENTQNINLTNKKVNRKIQRAFSIFLYKI